MKTGTIRIYKDAINEYRWRLLARNGKIIAESGESYKRRKAIANALGYLPLQTIEDVTGFPPQRFTNIEHWY